MNKLEMVADLLIDKAETAYKTGNSNPEATNQNHVNGFYHGLNTIRLVANTIDMKCINADKNISDDVKSLLEELMGDCVVRPADSSPDDGERTFSSDSMEDPEAVLKERDYYKQKYEDLRDDVVTMFSRIARGLDI